VPVAVDELVITAAPAIVNVTALDIAPAQGFTTVTDTVPAVATCAAGTVTTSCVEEEDVGVRLVPPKLTIEPETKFVPVTVKVKLALPAVTQLGLSELMLGTAVIVNVAAVDVAPQGLGFTTVTDAVPAVFTRVAGTAAVS
jgi:hypothetical protein